MREALIGRFGSPHVIFGVDHDDVLRVRNQAVNANRRMVRRNRDGMGLGVFVIESVLDDVPPDAGASVVGRREPTELDLRVGNLRC